MSIVITIDSTGEALTLDGYDGISFGRRVAVTSHPIEDGSPSTDHARREPDTFTIRGALVTPIRRNTPKPRAVEEAIGFFDRCVGELLTVDTVRDGRFRNVMLTGMPHTQLSTLGRRFDLSFTEMRIATPVTVTIPARQPAPIAGSGMADEVDAGKQATEAVGEQKQRSAAAAVSDFLYGGS